MSTAAIIPVGEYLQMTGKPYCEYDNGVLYPKAVPTTLHAWIQSVLILLLSRQGAIALSELTVPITPTAFLVPDVAVVARLQLPYPTDPALLCVEVLSPEDRIGAMLAKCEKYHAWGVPHCWVIDPVRRTAWEYHSSCEPAPVTGWLRAGELSVSLNELFAGLPKDHKVRLSPMVYPPVPSLTFTVTHSFHSTQRPISDPCQ
jgi:Uma2 family endonuclease